jgi:dipeptidyl aminopeptidase/acylaminoacyl peptidase
MIVVGRTTMQDPTDYFAFTPQTKKFERLTNINKEVMDKLNRIKIDEIWTNTKDGKKVHSWVAYPPNFDVNKKYPLITYCQGGPQSAVSHYWSYRWNIYLMASQGYIVVGPNRRGAPGFGQDWVDAISKDWGGKAMQDILDATDDVSKNSYVDKNRLAAVGASAGGFTTFWLAGNHEGRFSALVSHCGVFNFESMYGSTEELFFANSEFGGPYWDEKNKDFYEKYSPNKFVKKWKTPMLIYAGQKDYRVPYNQSLEAYTALKTQNIPGRLIVFPNENHWVLGLQNSFIWHSEFFEFLDKYCKSKVN